LDCAGNARRWAPPPTGSGIGPASRSSAGSASRDVYVGIGAFNLVRRSAYEGIGGHEAIRLEIADDLMLGKKIKQAGYRQEALLASDHLRLRWLDGVGGFIRGLEKNGFAAIGYSLPFLFLITLLVFLFYAVPYLGVLSFRDARGFGYGAAVLFMHGTYGYFTSFLRNGWLLAPALPAAEAGRADPDPRADPPRIVRRGNGPRHPFLALIFEAYGFLESSFPTASPNCTRLYGLGTTPENPYSL